MEEIRDLEMESIKRLIDDSKKGVNIDNLLKQRRKEIKIINITKKDFKAYEKVRVSGVTNMWAVDLIEKLSGLSREQILLIMKNYEEYMKMFPEVRK